MKVPLLDLKVQFADIRDDVMTSLMEVIESQRFIMGEPVGRLEEAVARLCGVEHGIACASGTDALLLSLKGLRLESGDEVITTPFTFFATAGAVVNAGGKPVFVDIEPGTFNLDIGAAADAVTERSRAIVPVHLFGQMVSIERFVELARRHDLEIIEDAAQAISARRRVSGDWVSPGQLTRAAAFSFFPSKNLGAWGDGGMIVTRDADLARRLERLRTHGGTKQYHHEEVGINSRLDSLQAAVLLAKLPYLEPWNLTRVRHAAAYSQAFADIDGLVAPTVLPENECVFHQYTVRADRRDDLKQYLGEQGIGSAVYYPSPLHLQPCFSDLGYRPGQFPEAERASREVLSLPVGPELTDGQRDVVIEAIVDFYR